MSWYVKNSDGKVFGPVDGNTLLSWVKDGRIDPFCGISNDLKSWKLASLEPSLEMDWIVENEPGQFYGPTHRAVIDDLVKSGSLSQTCRIYRDDHNGESAKEISAIRADAETAMAELKEEAERSLSEMESALSAAKDEAAALRKRAEDAEARVAELENTLSQITRTKEREWTTDVVEPEIISSAPPPMVRDIFAKGDAANTLAKLERQAQAELARMGAEGAKKFFRIKR